MSMWDHKNEIKRWFDNPKGTKVWFQKGTGWILTNTPGWAEGTIYIVNDRHASIRKKWIVRGKPQVQYKSDEGNWEDVKNEPIWSVASEYRFKLSKWDTPEGENPIAYHAHRLGNKGGKWIITIAKGKYFGNIIPHVPVGVTLMDENTCRRIVTALNSGELKLKDYK